MSIVKLSSHKQAAIKFHFSNGESLSAIFGFRSYTENGGVQNLDKMRPDWYGDIESTTVEIMTTGSAAFSDWFKTLYEDDPEGYIPVSTLPELLAKADAWRSPEALPNTTSPDSAAGTDAKPNPKTADREGV